MSDIKKTQKQTKNPPIKTTKENKVPFSHQMEVKDLVNPITVRRIRVFQFSVVVLIALAGAAYFWNYYLREPSGAVVVQEWIDAAGGMDAWNKIDHGQFMRHHEYFSETGDLLNEKIETFFFSKKDGAVKLLMHSQTPEGKEVWIGKDKEGYWASADKKAVDPRLTAQGLGMMCSSQWCEPHCASAMAFYRFSMPFKLTDDGVIPKLSGSRGINGKEARVLDVTYRPGVGRDKWVFLAPIDDNLIRKIEYHHKSDSGDDLPEEMYWSDYKEEAGLQISHKWTRYWSNGKVLEQYTFSNFDFGTSLPDQFFKRPGDIDWLTAQ